MNTETVIVKESGATAGRTVVATLARAGVFRALMKSLKVTGLDAKLATEGPFTLLAPTDDAFSNLAVGTLEGLLTLPSGRERLLWILSCHVVCGRLTRAEFRNGSMVRTMHGEPVRVSVEGDVVKADGAQVVQADIVCANGLVHVVDQVILPGK